MRDICEMCYICARGEGDTCRLRKDILQILQDCEKICCVSWNITDPREKRIYGGREAGNLKKWRKICGENMAGDLRGKYGGRFAGILWLGRSGVNPNTAVNDTEQW